jgi:hypothetical protein
MPPPVAPRRRLALALGAPLALGPFLAGCDLLDPGLRNQAQIIPTVGQAIGTDRIAARQCKVEVAILERPADDPVLSSSVWSVADDQSIPDDVRRAWAANGLRAGVITGELPQDVKDILHAPPPHQVNPATLVLPDGESTDIDLEAHAPELSLFLALPGRSTVGGKRFLDANGLIRARAGHDRDGAVALKLYPQLRHGPIRKDWSVTSGAGGFSPQELVVRNGQAEESFSDLAASLTLRPGQVAVLGTDPDRKGTLGSFLFARTEPGSDRRLQRVVLLWASQINRPVPPASLQPVDPPEMPLAAGTP